MHGPVPASAVDRLLALSRDLVLVLDRGGAVLHANRAWSDALGHDPAALRTEWAMGLVHADDRPRARASLRLLMDRGAAPDTECRMLAADGAFRAIAWRGERHAEGVVLVGTDVTAARALDQAHRLAGLGIWQWDPAADEVVWSDELCHLFGLLPGSVPPSFDAYLGFVEPSDRDRLRDAVAGALARGADFSLHHGVRTASGERRTVACRGVVLCDAAGVPMRLIGTCQDVTESSRHELALDLAPTAIVVADRRGRLSRVNRAAAALIGREPAELAGHPVLDLVHPADREREAIALAGLLSGRGEGETRETRILRADGTTVLVRRRPAIVRGADGEPLELVVAIEPL